MPLGTHTLTHSRTHSLHFPLPPRFPLRRAAVLLCRLLERPSLVRRVSSVAGWQAVVHSTARERQGTSITQLPETGATEGGETAEGERGATHSHTAAGNRPGRLSSTTHNTHSSQPAIHAYSPLHIHTRRTYTHTPAVHTYTPYAHATYSARDLRAMAEPVDSPFHTRFLIHPLPTSHDTTRSTSRIRQPSEGVRERYVD